MKDLKDMTQSEYDKLRGLCARVIGVFSSQVSIVGVEHLDCHTSSITILYKNFYKYSMKYDGDNFSEITRLI